MSRLGVPLMVLAAMLATSDADAFEVRHASDGRAVRWEGPTVTFVVDPSVEAAVPGGLDAVTRALGMWSGVSGGPQITVVRGPGGGVAAMDGQNTVLLAPGGDGPAGDALAVTVVNYAEETGEILDTDIVVNGAHAFAVLAAEARAEPGAAVAVEGSVQGEEGAAPFDLVHVVSHEMGHALGLGDVETDGAVMYAYTAPGDASHRAPATDDVAGLDAVYGAQAKPPGCGGASVGSAFGGVGAGAGWAAAAIVLGACTRRTARGRREARSGRP